ncbi:MAG: OmpH family outer membrane protein [Candidatus Omnitrophica bacterium]|nr:OmpH family outer membrane protein [Candidatus Omnitrophota bacterium]
MKKRNVSFVFIALIASLLGSQVVFAGNEKLGYVDAAKLFDAYEKTKDQDRKLQEQGKKKEEQRDALVYDIRQLKDELALMNGDMKNKKQETLEQKVQKLQDFDREAKKDLGEARSKVVREIFSEIDEAIKRFGDRGGYEMIFNEKAMLFHNDKLNVTDQILADLNKNYKSKRK